LQAGRAAAAGGGCGYADRIEPAETAHSAVDRRAAGADPWGAGLGALGCLAILSAAGADLLYGCIPGIPGAGNLSLVTLLTAPAANVTGAPIRNKPLPLRACAGFALIALGRLIPDGRLLPRKDSA